MQLNQF